MSECVSGKKRKINNKERRNGGKRSRPFFRRKTENKSEGLDYCGDGLLTFNYGPRRFYRGSAKDDFRQLLPFFSFSLSRCVFRFLPAAVCAGLVCVRWQTLFLCVCMCVCVCFVVLVFVRVCPLLFSSLYWLLYSTALDKKPRPRAKGFPAFLKQGEKLCHRTFYVLDGCLGGGGCSPQGVAQ